ncbi:MAG: hypothetical protein WDN06_02305 [Asticcacaulis sp.]
MIPFQTLVSGRDVFVLGSAPSASLDACPSGALVIACNGGQIPFAGLVPDILLVNNYTTRGANRVARLTLRGLAGRQARHVAAITGLQPFEAALESLAAAGLTWDSAEELTIGARNAIVETALGRPLKGAIGDNTASTGVTALAWAHQSGAASLGLSGISLHGNHSYIATPTVRKHVDIDEEILARLGIVLSED